ncbi:hypothetical protein GE09DRAFT_487184 [Coniochaeta sp. 2T2.1]|nr:hypothetical protein GE09DRAFT_487184 [Coniochaeta sp. 2T2.1]
MATGRTVQTTRRRTILSSATTSIRRGSLLFLIYPIFATWLPFVTANCGVEFLYPQPDLMFYYLDTINVTYTSNFSNPTLFAWCGQSSSPTQKYETSAPKFNGSVLVLLDFSSSDPCWFDLRPDTPACGDNSPPFDLLPVQRAQSGSQTTLGLLSPTSTSSIPSKTGADESAAASGGSLSTGAKAGIAIAVVGAVLILVAMAACFWFKRRKRVQDAVLAGHIIDHDHHSPKGHEKTPLAGNSAHSNGSTEPLQPIYDGFPGSTAYDDLRSRESSAYLQSPQSPSSSSAGFFPPARNNSSERHYLTERDELEAARLHSAPLPSGVVSYGPNPVTPNITPRPSTRFHDNPSTSSGETHEDYYAPSTQSISPQPQSQYPAARPAPPVVVSYGPNKITPTPPIALPTAPDKSVMNAPPDLPEFPVMAFPSHPFPSHEPQSPTQSAQVDTPDDNLVRYGLTDDPGSVSAVSGAPLPPYASTADFYAMEKGAIRKLQEPAAQAELPPTKDGYYHFGDHGTEYELQGAAPQNEQQQPHRPYRYQTAGLGNKRDLDEQKVLLDDVEMAHLREQKKRIRAAQQQQAQLAAQGAAQVAEEYEMQPGRASGSRGQSQAAEQQLR